MAKEVFMAFAILRVAKIKSVGGLLAAAHHNLRTREVPNADPVKTAENEAKTGLKAQEVVVALKERLKLVKRAVRADAVLAVEYMVTASPDFFQDREKGAAFLTASLAWIEKRHGKGNVLQAVVHHDETTPHLHCIITPIRFKEKKYTHKETKKTTVKKVVALDAKHYFGGKDKIKEMQTVFTNEVAGDFGLKRGVSKEKTKATHIQIKEWYAKALADLAGGGVRGKEEEKTVPLAPTPPTPAPEKPKVLLTEAGRKALETYAVDLGVKVVECDEKLAIAIASAEIGGDDPEPVSVVAVLKMAETAGKARAPAQTVAARQDYQREL